MSTNIPITGLASRKTALVESEFAHIGAIVHIHAPAYPTTRTPVRHRGVYLGEVLLYVSTRDPAGRVPARALEDGGAPFLIFRVEPVGGIL